jgi:predicted phosphoribosyltransferase
MVFKDRRDAGAKLVEKLEEYKGRKDAVVVGIPRGGVEIAREISDILSIPMVVVVVKKLGLPFNPEYGIGAVDADGEVYLSETARYEADKRYIEKEASRLKSEIKERLEKYGIKDIDQQIKNRVCIVVDDGIATGLTTMAAARYLKRHGAKTLILAVPVAPPDGIKKLEKEFDRIVYLLTPETFFAVSQFYDRFPQLSDDEVIELLK